MVHDVGIQHRPDTVWTRMVVVSCQILHLFGATHAGLVQLLDSDCAKVWK